MVEEETSGVDGSVCDLPAVPESPESAEDENSERPADQYNEDLKSVLLTSVLNLEKLDVDLYR